MADGSSEDHTGPKQITDLTFSAPDAGHVDTKKCENKTTERDKVNLSFYIELGASESCEKSVSRGVAADRSAADSTGSQKSCGPKAEESEDRKKRCFDRYDSSESSDSGVAVLSPTESSACSGSDIASPVSPRSPESACSTGSEGAGPARMPPWASDPAPPARRHALAPPAPRRTSAHHRRITEYFNHKMKPQNGIKRDSAAIPNDDTKRKCLPKNGVTHDLEKYISLLSQTLSPKVLLDVNSHEGTRKTSASNAPDTAKPKAAEIGNNAPTNLNGMIDYSRPKDGKEKTHTAINGFNGIRNCSESIAKEKPLNGLNDERKQNMHLKTLLAAPSAITKKLPSINDSVRTAPTTNLNKSPKKMVAQQVNGVVSSTTKLDSRMNGVTCGSNNLSLNIACKPSTTTKKETAKKIAAAMPKRTNRKSAAINDYNKNLTWSKVHNLKQMQVQKQKCLKQNIATNTPVKNTPGEASTAPKMNVPNGVRQVSMTMNGNLANNLANLNVPVTNLQNCHQINIPQPCNGTVTPNNLASFVAVPQNVMLTTLRIPQNGLPPQTINQQNNINAFNRPNVNVSSPSKLNGQFVFPLVQNLNGAVVQIPNLMAKMPNFVLPQNAHIATQRQDHLQSQQAAQFLINGTLLKLTNAMTPTYTNVNKSQVAPTSQSVPVMNKNVQTIPSVGMTVQPKTNFAVNFSHPVLMPQPGFIVTSVPNMNVKETWSYTSNMASASQTTCATQIVHQPATPIVTDFTTQTLHSSSIPIAPVKPPDNPIQGTDPPSSTVKEPDTPDLSLTKCDIPWLSKTVNNNIVPLDSKLPTRPFANVSVLSEKIEELKEKVQQKLKQEETRKLEATNELRKVEEVARREETIFTQITVLKDVSSNVQSTLIEANFSSATTESSESGIGTDKSIDSPSDSQTSKECDEDSSLSLSVSVCSVEAQSCQKSPILKQPKTLRFPPKSAVLPQSDRRTSSTDTTSTVTVCMWENCKKEFDSDSDLLEHLQSIHVESQAGKENYVCLWQQCKVRGKPSCSRLWLERHALSHGGSKPFKCIVDGCDRRFSTQVVLERHVNNHFSEASPNAGSSKKTSDSAAKLIRRNGKKLRYRRQPWSARMFDFFDAGMMEGLAYRLSRGTRWRLGGACPLREPPGRHTLTLHAALTATRYNAAEARREALLTYYPPHVIEDEWVPEKEVKRIKRVEISSLPAHTKVFLYEQFCSSYRKAPSPPPAKPHPMPPPRRLPARHCTSSRMLSNLIANKRKERSDCSATNLPVILNEDVPDSSRVSGAKKRKLGRVLGGKPFWPSGR